MPALFCLALKPALDSVRALLPEGAIIVAYLDDIYVVCDPSDAYTIFGSVRDELRRICHIDVNLGKLAVWSKEMQPVPDDLAVLGPDIWKADLPLALNGIKVVGSPIGTDEYIVEVGREVVNEEVQLLDFLPQLASLQVSWLLLYFCAVPRINHMLRTLSPRVVTQLAIQHDAQILDVFWRLFALPIPATWDIQLHGVKHDEALMQAQLPLRLGGCGLRNSCRTSSAAYWASWADCIPVLLERFPAHARAIVAELSRFAGQRSDFHGVQCLVEAELAGRRCEAAGWQERPAWVDVASGLRPPQTLESEWALGEWKHGWQYHGSRHLEQTASEDLERSMALPSTRINAAARGKARINSCKGRFAHAWLVMCPTTQHLQICNEELAACIRFRLGLAILYEGPDAHGFRRLADNRGGRLNARHNGMLAGWRQVFVEAGGAVPDRNVERLLADTHVPVPPGDLRRLDVIVTGLNVSRGLPLFCDITVVSPISRNGVPRAGTSNRGGRLLELADEDNRVTYSPVIESGLGALYCLGCEVYGRWGQPCIDLMQALVRERSRLLHPRVRRGVALGLQHRWWGILSVSLQKAVARAIVRDEGADLYQALLEPTPGIADLPVVI